MVKWSNEDFSCIMSNESTFIRQGRFNTPDTFAGFISLLDFVFLPILIVQWLIGRQSQTTLSSPFGPR